MERAFSKSREATAQDKIESAVVQFLGISFALILLDGLILALSVRPPCCHYGDNVDWVWGLVIETGFVVVEAGLLVVEPG